MQSPRFLHRFLNIERRRRGAMPMTFPVGTHMPEETPALVQVELLPDHLRVRSKGVNGPTVLLAAKTYGSVFYDKLTPSIVRTKW
jgi:hypothetical protein